jgi:hypothetical protein
LSGVVANADGVALPSVVVHISAPTGSVDVTTDAAGIYSAAVPPGLGYRMRIGTLLTPVSYDEISDNEGFEVPAAGLIRNVSFPAVHALNVSVVDADNVAVVGAQVALADEQFGNFNGYSVSHYTGGAPCSTDSTGTCLTTQNVAFGLTDGSPAARVHVTPPGGGFKKTVSFQNITDPNITIQLTYFAYLESAGTVPGPVTVTIGNNGSLSDVGTTPVTDLPPGETAPVGGIGFHVDDVPADSPSVTVSFELPEGALPTDVYLRATDGSLTDITHLVTIHGRTVTLTVTDGGFGDEDGVKNGTIIVGSIIPVVRPAMTVATTILNDGVVGTAYSEQLSTNGGVAPFTWSVATGALPAGVTLSSSGLLSGTPTSVGPFSFSVQVTDSRTAGARSANRDLSITVAPATAMAITTPSVPRGRIGQRYARTSLAATGGTSPYTWSLDSGSLPEGMTLSVGGVLAGRPTVAGMATFVVKATDGSTPALSATRQFQLWVAPMQITTASLANAKLNTPYSAALVVRGGKGIRTWSLAAGALPPGLQLSPAGKITGTATRRMTATFTVKATDASSPANTATKQFTLRVV